MFNWRCKLTVARCFELKSRITNVQVTVAQMIHIAAPVPPLTGGSYYLPGSFFACPDERSGTRGFFFGEAKKNNKIIRRFFVN